MSKYLIGGARQYVSVYDAPPPSAQPGQVWYDGGRQELVVYTGSGWQPLTKTDYTLTWEADTALDYVIKRMQVDQTLSTMADKYPLVAEALGQLEVALKLCQNIDVNKT
jgi:hypothetical protein